MSTLNVANITDGTTTVGTSYVVNGSAKAWIYWTTASPSTAYGSFNVASIVDNGTGDTSINVSNQFNSSANICTVAMSNNYHMISQATPSVGQFRLGTYSNTHSAVDAGRNYATVDGDLA